jgi:hypothetical protein
VYRILVEKPEGKRPLGRPRRRWEDGIWMDLRKTGCVIVEWVQFAQNRECWRTLVNTVMNLQVLAPPSELVMVKELVLNKYWKGWGNTICLSPPLCYWETVWWFVSYI